MKKILLMLTLFFISTSLFSQTKEDDIRTLMEISGSAEMGIQIIDSMVQNFKVALPDVPDEYWDVFMDEVSADEIIRLIIPIYDKHFTRDEILEIIEFYKSDVGQKMVEKLPEITNESMIVGQNWGAQIGERLLNKLRDDGFVDV